MWKSLVVFVAAIGFAVPLIAPESSQTNAQAPNPKKGTGPGILKTRSIDSIYIDGNAIGASHDVDNHDIKVEVKTNKEPLNVDASKVWIVVYRGANPTIPDTERPPGTPITSSVASGNLRIWTRDNIEVHDSVNGTEHTLVVWIYYETGPDGDGFSQKLWQRKIYHFLAKTMSSIHSFAFNGAPLAEGVKIAFTTRATPGVLTVTTNKMDGVHPSRVLFKHLPGKLNGPLLIEKQTKIGDAIPLGLADPASQVKNWVLPLDGLLDAKGVIAPAEYTVAVWAVYSVKGQDIYRSGTLRYQNVGNK